MYDRLNSDGSTPLGITPQLASDDILSNHLLNPSVAVASDGTVHAVWFDPDGEGAEVGRIRHNFKDADADEWNSSSYISTISSSALAAPDADVAVGYGDTVYAVWVEDGALAYAVRDAQTEVWSTPTVITGTTMTNLDAAGALVSGWGLGVHLVFHANGDVYYVMLEHPMTQLGEPTKRYFAGGQPIATRMVDELYYTLTDPTGTSLVMTNAAGNEAGRLLVDGYGGVLTSTLPITLTGTMPDVPDAATGLVHQGNGRWYDPALGRPLQPNPVNGPATSTQAFNRYNATPWGQPGVYQAKQSSWNPFTDNYISNIGKALASNVVEDAVLHGAYVYLSASAYTIVGDPIVETVTKAVAKSNIAEKAIVTAGAAGILIGDRVPASLRRIGRHIFDKAIELNTRFVTEEIVVGYSFSYGHRFPAGRILGKLLGSKIGEHVIDAGVGLGIDIGYQVLLDVGNPYLSSSQIIGRAVLGQGTGSLVSFGIGALAEYGITAWLGAAVGGPVGFAVGVGVSIAWDIWAAPWIYENIGLEPTRNLAKLGS